MTNSAYDKLKELQLSLPDVATPAGNYVPWVRSGNLLFIAGQVSRNPDGTPLPGKLGDGMTVDEGYQAARTAGLRILAAVDAATGDLNKVRVLKLFGMVNSTPTFGDHPKVINGCSDLLVQVLGELGKHARCAVGHVSLPSGAAVEIESLFEIND